MQRIILTGGGSAGHVTPNLALVDSLLHDGWEIHYIGSKKGIERVLVKQDERLCYHVISSGKMRRYIDLKNISDPFKVFWGTLQSLRLLGKLAPRVVFSKGGFVSVPVAVACRMRRTPLIVHESDMTPGLANRIATRFAKRVCTNFPETLAHFPPGKAVHTGTPVRVSLLEGDASRGRELCGFTDDKPVLLFVGGSLGARAINEALGGALERLLARYQVIHICGKGQGDPGLSCAGYRQFEYVTGEMADLLACAGAVVSRAGANALAEFLTLKKPSLLIPLPLSASRGDQIQNAQSFCKQGYSHMLEQEKLTPESLLAAIDRLWASREALQLALNSAPQGDGIRAVLEVIRSVAQGE